MLRPPDPETRSPATRQSDGSKSQINLVSEEAKSVARELQERKLQRCFCLAKATAYTVASLAWGLQ
jgi:hypothetical protein